MATSKVEGHLTKKIRLEVQLLSDHLPPLQVCFCLIIDSLPNMYISGNRPSSKSGNFPLTSEGMRKKKPKCVKKDKCLGCLNFVFRQILCDLN